MTGYGCTYAVRTRRTSRHERRDGGRVTVDPDPLHERVDKRDVYEGEVAKVDSVSARSAGR